MKCVGEENVSLLILIDRENIENTALSVFSYFMPIVYVHNCEMCKKSLISGG